MKTILFRLMPAILLTIAGAGRAATFTVVNTNSSGTGSLQQAILDANASAGADTVDFNIASAGWTIGLTNALPTIVEPLTINGASQPGFAGVPIVELNGTSAGAAIDGLKIATSNCVVRSLVINRFLGDGIEITNGVNNLVEGCYIGLSATGLVDQGNTLNGILITNAANNTIGGLFVTNRNYISGNNQSGVNFGGAAATNNTLLGNYVGLNVTNGAVANSVDGLRINAALSVVGGNNAGARNIISGNTGQGVEVTAVGAGTIIRGNYIGTDDSGLLDRGNSADGILVSSGGVKIGGSVGGDGNLIAGNNDDGIELNGLSATNNLVLGNTIGGSLSLPNAGNGVLITTSSRSNVVGGISLGEGNVIAFNGADGINVAAANANTNNAFRGNSIYLNGTATAELGIDLGASGVLLNDIGDGDVGANQLQNFPLLAWATNTPNGTVISGSLNSRPSTTYSIDFYANTEPDTDGVGEGRYYIGSTNLATAADSNLVFTITLPTVALPARYLCATATDPFGNTSEFSTNVFAQSTVSGTTFTVVNTNDAGPGSLRQAIADANINISAGDTIAFAITNLGFTISPLSALPTIIDPVTIDGYTQAGSAPNTSATAFNGTVLVTVSGTSAGSGSDGLRFTVGNNTVRGLTIINFLGSTGDGLDFSGGGTNIIKGNLIGIDLLSVDRGNAGDGIHIANSSGNIIGGLVPADRNVISGNQGQGIDISGASSVGHSIRGNIVGTDLSGTIDVGNSSDGIIITTAGTNTVGGLTGAERNLISGNNGDGVAVASGGSSTVIRNNYIGTDASGGLDLGNGGNGVTFTAASNSVITANLISGNSSDGIELSGLNASNIVVTGNLIGTTASGNAALGNSGNGVLITSNARFNQIGTLSGGNTIAFNLTDGIQVASGTNISIRANSIFLNGNATTELGIDLGTSGVTANDVGDADTGANQLQNFPTLTNASNGLTGTVISGTFSGATNREFSFDFYSSVAVNSSGNGEGQVYLGTTNLTTDGNGFVSFTVGLPVTNLVGRYLTATATDTNGNTSEFSASIATISSLAGLVFTVVNTNDSGAGSLRQAIIDANAAINSGDTIQFAITNLGTTISPSSALPVIIDAVTINGTTQPGAVLNTATNTFNGVVPVVLNGSSAGAGVDGLRFTTGGNVVRGLNIINFTQDGLEFTTGNSNVVEGCLIGLDAASVDRGNSSDGIRLTSSSGNRIGGNTAAARNVLSGNNGDGIEINGVLSTNNVVSGNLIGTDLNGAIDRGNGNGVVITAAPFNRIGGTNTLERNVISGNSQGVLLQTAGATNNLIVGNFIGTDAAGLAARPNSNEGVFISAVGGNIVGTIGAGNLISGNNGDGIEINGIAATTNVVQANLIGVNAAGTLAIPNGNNGVLLVNASGTQIGGVLVAAGNVISGNFNDGIEINGASAAGNMVRNNRIGVAADGATPLGNGNNGVLFTASAHDNLIGGSGNIIGHNVGDGVFVNSGTNNSISANSILGNGGLGVDLAPDGVSANDATDSDAGANQLQNAPVLSGATNNVSSVTIAGLLTSQTNTTYVLEFFASASTDASGAGEGQFFLGATNVTTDGAGLVNFQTTLPTTLPGRYVSATATDPFGNTSEFATNIFASSTVAGLNLVVINTNDNGAGSLRAAIVAANAAITTGDTITYNIPGTGVQTIALASALPAITDPVTINGFSQAGASANTLVTGNNAVIRVQLNGASAGVGANGLSLVTRDSLVQGLAVVSFDGDAIQIEGGFGNRIEGCYLGLDADGSTRRGNTGNGVNVLSGAIGNVIGGTTPAARCVISANQRGVVLTGVASNLVQGAWIGTDGTGQLNRGNTNSGILITGTTAMFNTIGGTTAAARNVISGNGQGFVFEGHGITLSQARFNSILGNYIGLTVSGSIPLGNQDNGIHLDSGASTNYLGGGISGAGNVISANTFGIDFSSDSPDQIGNVVQGNLIGTDASGLLSIGNAAHGISFSFADFNQIGGTNALERNVISGNLGNGVNINCCAALSNVFEGNFIGVASDGVTPLGNNGFGVYNGSPGTRVGGIAAGAGNVIAYNNGSGVLHFISSSQNVAILGNSIFANSGLGIDLGLDNGPTANDLNDADSGPNGLQNYPVVAEALRYPTETVLTVNFNSRSNTAYRIELFQNAINDPSGFGEGQSLILVTNLITDGAGNVGFSFTNPVAMPLGQTITATATDPSGNTSEFSAARKIVAFDSVDVAISVVDSADPAPHTTNYFYTITVTNFGPATATAIFVTNTLPVGTAFVAGNPSQGTTALVSGQIVWNVGSVTKNSAATLKLEIDSTTTGIANDSAVVISAETDNDLANNTATQSTQLGIADLVVTASDSPDPVIAGQPVSFSVTVTNLGPDTATDAVVSLSLDGGFVGINASSSQGALSQNGNFFVVNLGTLPVGTGATLAVTAIPVESGIVTSVASANCSETDPFSGNNGFVSVATTVNAGAGVVEFLQPESAFNEASANAFVWIVRRGGSIGTVTANYATTNRTAIGGSDYVVTTGTITFNDGEVLKSVLVPMLDDAVSECNEFYGMTLANPTGGAVLLRTTNTLVMIVDNEILPSGTISTVSATDTNLPLDPGNNNSFESSVSADGRYVVFTSEANSLVANDSNFQRDVFVRDLLTQTTKIVSQGNGSGLLGNNSSGGAQISGNGRYVVFSSSATVFATDDNNGTQDVFVRDLLSNQTTLVSRQVSGSGTADGFSLTPAPNRSIMSSNGLGVVYTSFAENLTTLPDANFDSDIFYYDLAAGTNRLISVKLDGSGAGDSWAQDPVISADNRIIAFESAATNLVTVADANFGGDVFAHDLATGVTELISVSLTGSSAANGLSGSPYLSADGRYVTFNSSGSNIAANDSNTRVDVFRRDRVAGTTTLVSVNTNGLSGNSSSTVRGISADGRYVVFSSFSSDLVAGDYNGLEDVFVRDLVANLTLLVSRTPIGDVGNGASFNPVISGNGAFVAFESYATDLNATPKNGDFKDIFLRNMTNNTMRLVSYRNGTTNGAASDSYAAAISYHGEITSFTGDPEQGIIIESRALATNGSLNYTDVWAHRYASNTTELVSVSANSSTANGFSFAPQLNDSGSHVVFSSHAVNLVGNDTNSSSDVYLLNLTNQLVTLVSLNVSNASSGNSYSDSPRVSSDARYVAFVSGASDLVASDTNNAGDVFRRDLQLGVTVLASINAAGSGAGNGFTYLYDLSPNGRYILMGSQATNLFASDFNGDADDIVLRDMVGGTSELISFNSGGSGSAAGYSYSASMSDDARYVVYESDATNIVSNDLNQAYDVFLRDRLTGTNILCSRDFTGSGSGNFESLAATISASGAVVVFQSSATNLTVGDTNQQADLFAFDTATKTRELVSKGLNGSGANGASFDAVVSADGRYVAFVSYATNLAANDSNGDVSDVFLRDRIAGTTILISSDCDGLGSGNRSSQRPQISANGRYVIFQSYANNLLAGSVPDGVENVYRYDRITGELAMLSQNRFVTGGGNNSSFDTSISADGAVVAFVSSANNLVADDFNSTDDIFVWQGNVVATGVDLVFSKDVATNSVSLGANFTYTLTATNFGSTSASSVLVTDVLPAGLSFVGATTTAGTITNAGGIVTASLGTLAPNAGASIQISVAANAIGSISNYANVAAFEADDIPGNNSDAAVVTVIAAVAPSLSIQPTNGTQLLITWPASAGAGFNLETTTNLAPVIVWSPVTNSVVTSGINKVVILGVNPADSQRFYRLKQ